MVDIVLYNDIILKSSNKQNIIDIILKSLNKQSYLNRIYENNKMNINTNNIWYDLNLNVLTRSTEESKHQPVLQPHPESRSYVPHISDTKQNNLPIKKEKTVTGLTSSTDHNKLECTVCMDAERSILLLPCRHLALCETCSNKCSKCPICRTTIASKIKAIVS